MSVYYTLCFLAALAIFIAFANQYVVKIQTTIAITAGSMLISALMVLFGKLGWFNLEPLAVETMESIDFQNFLLKGILGFLLFAGGLGINLQALRSQKWEFTILSPSRRPCSPPSSSATASGSSPSCWAGNCRWSIACCSVP